MHPTAQKMKFSFKDFSSKCDKIRRKKIKLCNWHWETLSDDLQILPPAPPPPPPLFFYLDFLSRTFTIHKTAGEGRGYLFNFSLPLPPASQTLRH